MPYFVYITIDPKRRKFYLGCHNGPLDLSDSYYGSNRAIRYIQKKRHPHALRRIILEICADERVMYEREAWWGEQFRVMEDSRFYNRNACGKGGFGHLRHQRGAQHPRFGQQTSEETKAKISQGNKGKKRSLSVRAQMSAQRKGKNHPMFGRQHRADSIEKNRRANLGKEPPNKGKKTPDHHRLKKCLSWLFTGPDGREFVVQDRRRFCEEHGISYSSAAASEHLGRPVKGWYCRRQTERP